MDKNGAKKNISGYFHDHWWKYLLIFACAFIVIRFVVDMASPRLAEQEKLEIYFCAGDVNQFDLEEMAKKYEAETVPYVKPILFGIPVDMAGQKDYVYQMQFTLHINARQGDAFIVSRRRFLEDIAPKGVALVLEEKGDFPYVYVDGNALGIDISSLLPLEEAIGFNPVDCVAFLPFYCSNPEESYEFVAWLFSEYVKNVT